MNEKWHNIIDYENMYQISNYGNVKSLKNNKIKILKPQIDGCGYYQVFLYKNKKAKKYKVHQLVAKYFVSNEENLKVVNHKDGNKLNNNANNLEWCTHSYNNKHAYDNKLKTPCFKIIYQYSKNNKFIKVWNGALEIERCLKINNSNIIQCCKNKRKTAGGYIWKYKENVI